MKITNLGNGKISIETPYNPEFVCRIRKAGGKWNSTKRVWECDERGIEAVRAIMREVYGMDDLPQELVAVKVTVQEKAVSQDTGPVILFGRTIASAFGRDSGAKVGEGIIFENGGCHSGGSMKNWYTVIKAGSVFTIFDVPRRAVEEKLGWVDSYGTFEIVENAGPDRRESLEREKAALLARLAEIEEELKSLSA